jgi:hypothetical protein
MIIANPISDTVFKWLMDDVRIARFFIETLLEETITEVALKPQELPKEGQLNPGSLAASFAMIRLDFIATIKTGTGEYKKVLIEIQKARNPTDIMRFRNYLGKHYMREDDIYINGDKKMMALPIITIYLLGFKLPEIPTPAVKVSRQYVDQISHEVITGKNDFIEKLTHDSYVVQIPRIEGKLHSRLEQTLSFFEQKYYLDETHMIKEYPYPIEDEHIKMIADALHYAGTDPDSRKIIDIEIEAYRVYNVTHKELQEALTETKKAMEKTDKELQETNKELEEKSKELEEKNKKLEEMAKEIEQFKRGS